MKLVKSVTPIRAMFSFHRQFLATLEPLHHQMQETLTDVLRHCYESHVWVGSNDGVTWISQIAIEETNSAVMLQVQIPKVLLQNLEIQISSETASLQSKLTSDDVEGFFSPGYIKNIIPLPISVHPEAIQAQLNGTVLTLILPKSSQVQRQRFTIQPTQDLCQIKSHFLTRVEP